MGNQNYKYENENHINWEEPKTLTQEVQDVLNDWVNLKSEIHLQNWSEQEHEKINKHYETARKSIAIIRNEIFMKAGKGGSHD